MIRSIALLCAINSVALGQQPASTLTLDKTELQDKIKGGWAGQVIGCTYGGPTEFRFRGSMIPDDVKIPWDASRMRWYYEKRPGLYDDVYMDLTFVEVFEDEGLDAPAKSHALAFATAEYKLWHANQMARYNILRGILPPESGHWLQNPHADDIDFQIEADFAGLMSPGMVNTSAEICDKVGHIMNYGDGWYGGVYVAAMYSLAFARDDIQHVVEEALEVIPKESLFYQCQADVIRWYRENPDEWKATWRKVNEKWSDDVGCPNGVFKPYNIDAKVNCAWILLGLLYGNGDYGDTIVISTRSGDDSDCNPASAAGILGTMIGYSKIPAYWKQGLAVVEPLDFAYTTISLNDVYGLSYGHALQLIKKNGGRVADSEVTIPLQNIRPVPLEIAFAGHYPTQRQSLSGKVLKDTHQFQFEGIGFVLTARTNKKTQQQYDFKVEMAIDGKVVETFPLSTDARKRSVASFFRYQLPQRKHNVQLRVLNPTDKAEIRLQDLIVYGPESRK